MAEMAQTRQLFHSEADFQHAFAWEAHRRFPDASIRLEKPISVTDGGVIHLDVLIQHSNTMIAVELKYKTQKLSFEMPSETFSLRNHSAKNWGRYDFIKDIRRLERIATDYPKALGYAVLLTNESAYWRAPSASITVDAAFRLHEGIILEGKVAWGEGASAGTMKNREELIDLCYGPYPLKWRDFSSVSTDNSSVFRYLVVAVKK